jgi:hypothetical protein
VADRPYPVADPDSAPFWAATAQRRLTLAYCADCSRLRHPPTPHCPACLHPLTEWREVSGRATLHAWTTVHAGLVPGLDVPYLVAEVELDEQTGLVLTSNLVGPSAALRVGVPLELSWSDPYEDGTRLPLFRLVGGAP